MIPVFPATPAVLERPLGVAAIMFPHRSTTHILVVPPCVGNTGIGVFVAFMLSGSPGRTSSEAFFMSIKGLRSRV